MSPLSQKLIDDECMKIKSKKQAKVLKQTNRVKQAWDATIALSAFLNGFFIPFHIAFEANIASVISLIIQILYSIDFFLQFRVATFD